MAHNSGPQQNYSPWDAPTLPPGQGQNVAPPPLPLTPDTASLPPGDYPPPTPPRRRPPNTRQFGRRGRIIRRVLLALLLLALLGAGLLAHRMWDFGSAISNQGPLTTQTRFMSGNGRVNVLVLGYGGGNHPGPYLTDTMMVISLNLSDHATTMISVPRDLWVQVPPGSGDYSKLNTAYVNGLESGFNGIAAGPVAGGAEAAQKVTEITGLKIDYWLTINFNGFRALVDALGGVDIDVPVGWTAINLGGDGLPGNGVATFKAGWQHMDGERALQYARARYITNPASEGTDFARAKRQQVLLRAIVDRTRSPGSWPHLFGAMDALQQTIYSNLSLADLLSLMEKADFNHAAQVGLTTQNVLVNGVTSDGQDILQPANGDWNAVQQYVAAHLKP
ncbi:MAG TPA: LCP family protein [Ktedonobacterales bacterium]|nr:LCP family protein [Ktedonobacterales bacterium]